MPPSYLDANQRETLAQFQSITARDGSVEGERSSLEALESAGWNLEAAISRVYDGGDPTASTSRMSYPPTRDEVAAEVDDALLPSSNAADPPRRRSATTNGMGTSVVGLYYLRQALAVPIQILSWPLSIVYNLGALVLGFIARLLGFRISTSTFHPRNPFASTTRSGNRRRPRTILSPAAAARNWVDSVHRLVSLPEAINAITPAETTGIQVGSSAQLLSRRGADRSASDTAQLPEFFIGGYEQALRKARDDLKLLMVILTCEENERDDDFKRQVLTDPELISSLRDEQVLVWGGDVLDRDAYQVGRTLSYTSLPCIAFIALQPANASSTPSSSSSSASPRLSLVSRIEPSAALPNISATHVHSHLHSTVLPKSKPYLARLAADKQRREAERHRREQEEHRQSEIARQDEVRILEIRKALEMKQQEEQKQRELAQLEQIEFERKRVRAELARRWREIKREQLRQTGPAIEGREGSDAALSVGVKLGNGKRVMRKFTHEQPVVDVYEWVECELGHDEDQQYDPNLLSSGPNIDLKLDGYVQKFAFRLATTFPRQVIELPPSRFEDVPSPRSSFDSLHRRAADGTEVMLTVGEAFAGMGKAISLVIDGLEDRRRLSMSSREDEDEEEEWEEDGDE
ncbi:uncharacterized protein JCM15063_006560 [Sporobolomyces koalae]|uniref:uncharacterized protein n=1 Tax=Sporobolomyces koalae TaxID=500713 RepID=UPI00317BCB39